MEIMGDYNTKSEHDLPGIKTLLVSSIMSARESKTLHAIGRLLIREVVNQ